MRIEEKCPIILTKDGAWAHDYIRDMKSRPKEGTVIVLPEDAVLVEPK